MASSIRQAFGTPTTACSTGLNGLTNGTIAASAAQDNSATGFFSVLVQTSLVSTGAVTGGYVNLWLVRSGDTGSKYDDNNRTLLTSPVITTTGSTGTMTFTWDTASAGALGYSYKIALENQTGGTLYASSGTHTHVYTGLTSTAS